MMILRSLITLAAIAFSVPAPAATTDPEIIIYRFPGVHSTAGVDNVGIATSFHCTNFSGTTETIRVVVRTPSGALATNTTHTIDHLQTLTISTKGTNTFTDSAVLSTGAINQGTAAFAATSTSIVCTAMIVDAGTSFTVGISLHGIRFNPVPGSQE
jgi:hypothetical protein